MVYEFCKDNPAYSRWVIATPYHEKAVALMAKIANEYLQEPMRKIVNQYAIQVQFSDGVMVNWFNPLERSKGCMFGRIWCDKSIDSNIFNVAIRPFYVGDEEDIIWF